MNIHARVCVTTVTKYVTTSTEIAHLQQEMLTFNRAVSPQFVRSSVLAPESSRTFTTFTKPYIHQQTLTKLFTTHNIEQFQHKHNLITCEIPWLSTVQRCRCCQAMLCKHSLCCHVVCVCVSVCVMFVHSVKTNTCIFKIFHCQVTTPSYHSSFFIPNLMVIFRQ